MRKFSLKLGLLSILLCFFTSAAWAEGFGLYEYSARGIALGGAMVARTPDPSCVAYNPALLTRLPGTHMMLGTSTVTPSGSMYTNLPGGGEVSTKLKDSTWVMPHIYFTHQINDRLTFGIGEFTRFGLGFEYPENWPGRYNIYSVSMLSASLNPTLAFKVNDELSRAAGVEGVFVNLDLQKRAPLTIPGVGNLDVDSNIQDAQAFGIGFNLAAHYQFNDQWAAGVSYRSSIKTKAFGHTEFTKREYTGAPEGKAIADAAFEQNFNNGQAHATVILPESVSMGVSYSPIPELSFEVGAIWTRWSSFKNLRIYLPNGVLSESRKDWNNAWRLNAGVEYQALDWLTLRAGYVYDRSPMNEMYEDYLVPTDGRHIYSAGLGFSWDNWTLDLAYAYIDAIGREYDYNPQRGVHKSKAYGHTNIFSMSVGYEF